MRIQLILIKEKIPNNQKKNNLQKVSIEFIEPNLSQKYILSVDGGDSVFMVHSLRKY